MSNRRIANCIDAIGEAISSVNIAVGELERAQRELSAGVDGAGPVWSHLKSVRAVLVAQAAALALVLDAASNLLQGGNRG